MKFNQDEINNCLNAIETRNKIIHEWLIKNTDHKTILKMLFQTISKIICLDGGILPKFPRIELEPYSK
jgi:hypothetical protein